MDCTKRLITKSETCQAVIFVFLLILVLGLPYICGFWNIDAMLYVWVVEMCLLLILLLSIGIYTSVIKCRTDLGKSRPTCREIAGTRTCRIWLWVSLITGCTLLVITIPSAITGNMLYGLVALMVTYLSVFIGMCIVMLGHVIYGCILQCKREMNEVDPQEQTRLLKIDPQEQRRSPNIDPFGVV